MTKYKVILSVMNKATGLKQVKYKKQVKYWRARILGQGCYFGHDIKGRPPYGGGVWVDMLNITTYVFF